MYRIMASVLGVYKYGFGFWSGWLEATYVTFVTTRARYFEMLRAQSFPGYGYTCHSRLMG